jgi:tryptophan-rich sensory protein
VRSDHLGDPDPVLEAAPKAMKIPVGSSTSYRGRNYRPNWLALAGFVGLALAVGLLGERLSGSTGAWYSSLVKPAWTPPDRWLGLIWTILCIMMGAAAWLVWRERYHRARNAALLAYAIQLCLNAAWAPIFFGARSVGAGLFVIAALWLAIVWTLREFAAVRSEAAWLLLPYLGWVSVAAAVNFSIWRHN